MIEELSADELTKEAKNAYQRKDYLTAARAYQAAAGCFKSGGDEITGAEMENNASVALLQSGDAESALNIVMGTDKIFASAGDRRRQAIALSNQAAAYEALGQLDSAAQAYISASELLKQIGDHKFRPIVMQSLSSIQLRLGSPVDALVTLQAGLDQIEKPNLKQRLIKKITQSPFNYFK